MCHYNLQKRIASAADYTSRLQGFRGLEFRSSEDIKCPQQTLLLSRTCHDTTNATKQRLTIQSLTSQTPKEFLV